MSKSLLTLILSLFVALVLILTNPKEEEHKSAVKTKFHALLTKMIKDRSPESGLGSDLGAGLGALVGSYAVDRLVDTGISRTNLLLFSLTRMQSEKETKTIGVGVLGSVYLTSKFDEIVSGQSDSDKEKRKP